jgi:hypothetical protein
MLSPTDYERHFKQFNILGCIVRSKNIFYFLTQEDYTNNPRFQDYESPPDDDELKRRSISWMRQKPAVDQWSASEFQGFVDMKGAMTFQPLEQLIISGLRSSVFSIGSGKSGMEDNLPSRGPITKVKTIGFHAYACGLSRTLAKRDSSGTWLAHHKKIPSPKEKSWEVIGGFYDVDGFSETDIYAVGGQGDVWQFNGGDWRKCAFPSNIALHTVCCGADGSVYITGSMGKTFIGRNDQWKVIAEPGISIPFKDTVWYQDRLWGTNDYGVWGIKNGEMQLADIPGSTRLCSGYLSARDGILLIAGHGGAAFLENEKWQVIFHPNEFK